jgi:hypothetical protein
MFVKKLLDAMIRNSKIHNILGSIEILKSMKLNKCIH